MPLNLKSQITDIPDFPQKGVVFKDITPLLNNPKYFTHTINLMYQKAKKLKVDKILAIESRGYIFASALAYKLKVGFIPCRKANKLLPRATLKVEYQTEYSTDGLKIHKDAILKNEKVLIVDDLVATGGSALAAVQLVEKAGGIVSALLFLNELTFLQPRQKLNKYPVISLVKYY